MYDGCFWYRNTALDKRYQGLFERTISSLYSRVVQLRRAHGSQVVSFLIDVVYVGSTRGPLSDFSVERASFYVILVITPVHHHMKKLFCVITGGGQAIFRVVKDPPTIQTES